MRVYCGRARIRGTATLTVKKFLSASATQIQLTDIHIYQHIRTDVERHS